MIYTPPGVIRAQEKTFFALICSQARNSQQHTKIISRVANRKKNSLCCPRGLFFQLKIASANNRSRGVHRVYALRATASRDIIKNY